MTLETSLRRELSSVRTVAGAAYDRFRVAIYALAIAKMQVPSNVKDHLRIIARDTDEFWNDYIEEAWSLCQQIKRTHDEDHEDGLRDALDGEMDDAIGDVWSSIVDYCDGELGLKVRAPNISAVTYADKAKVLILAGFR